jgi:hypothetical protein
MNQQSESSNKKVGDESQVYLQQNKKEGGNQG